MAISAVRAAIIYIVLIIAMRVMGKRQLGDWQPSELVVTLLAADMAAVAMEDNGTPLLQGLLPIAVLVSLELLLSGLELKMPAIARLMGGRPVMLINNGQLDQTAMKRLRLSLEDVLGALRQQGVFDIRDVQYAVAETGGQISLSLKPAVRPATAGDMGVPLAEDDIPFLVVSDGQISRLGLSMCGQTEEWLFQVLRDRALSLSDVFLLIADQRGETYVLTREEGASP